MQAWLEPGRKHPWRSPSLSRVLDAGQSNAVNINAATPSPVPPVGADYKVVAQGGTSLQVDWQFGQPSRLRESLRDYVQSANGPVSICWSQGETDQDNSRTQAQYYADFVALYNDVNLQRRDVLWVVCYLSKNTKYGAGATIRLAQQQAVATLLNVEPLNTDIYEFQGDGVHYANTTAVLVWQAALAIMQGR